MERLRSEVDREVRALLYSAPQHAQAYDDDAVSHCVDRVLRAVAARSYAPAPHPDDRERQQAMDLLATVVRRGEHVPRIIRQIRFTTGVISALLVLLLALVVVYH